MKQLKEQFGIRIQELRKSKKLTQEQFAEKIGLDTPNISNIEHGKRFISAATLEKIIKALEVQAKDLFDFQHIKSRSELLNSIIEILNSSDDKELEFYYRMMSLYKEY